MNTFDRNNPALRQLRSLVEAGKGGDESRANIEHHLDELVDMADRLVRECRETAKKVTSAFDVLSEHLDSAEDAGLRDQKVQMAMTNLQRGGPKAAQALTVYANAVDALLKHVAAAKGNL